MPALKSVTMRPLGLPVASIKESLLGVERKVTIKWEVLLAALSVSSRAM